LLIKETGQASILRNSAQKVLPNNSQSDTQTHLAQPNFSPA
jgi:hypothetical protein